jgi:hypothetical protein
MRNIQNIRNIRKFHNSTTTTTNSTQYFPTAMDSLQPPLLYSAKISEIDHGFGGLEGKMSFRLC